MNKKAVLELGTVKLFLIGLLIIGVVAITVLLVFLSFDGLTQSFAQTDPGVSSKVVQYNVATTVAGAEGGLASINPQRYNQTYLNFDGVDDVATIVSSDTTISFWYKNQTSDWFHVVNSSGTTYVNGGTATPDEYPVNFNGTQYDLGKTNATHFFNGSIDEVRVYDIQLNSEEVILLYNLGR